MTTLLSGLSLQAVSLLLFVFYQGKYYQLFLGQDSKGQLQAEIQQISKADELEECFYVHVLLKKQKVSFDGVASVIELNKVFGPDFEMTVYYYQARLLKGMPYDFYGLYSLSRRLMSTPNDLLVFLDQAEQNGLSEYFLSYHRKQIYLSQCANEQIPSRLQAQLEAQFVQYGQVLIQIISGGSHWALSIDLYAGLILDDVSESILSLVFFQEGALLRMDQLPINRTIIDSFLQLDLYSMMGVKISPCSSTGYSQDYRLAETYRNQTKKKIFLFINYRVPMTNLEQSFCKQVSTKIQQRITEGMEVVFTKLKGQYKNNYLQNGNENSIKQSADMYIPMISHDLKHFYVEQGLMGSREGEQLEQTLIQQMTLDLLL